MPRIARAAAGGVCYHVLNRGNNRNRVFLQEGDYRAFLALMIEAQGHIPMRTLAYCLMPNHFHLVVYPHGDGDLGRWVHWLLTTHGQRYLRCHATSGHLWQGRYKSFPIQEDHHLLAVMRYAERNPLRAGLVRRAEEWPWSSLRARSPSGVVPPLAGSPVDLPPRWLELVNEEEPAGKVDLLRKTIGRGSPFGDGDWSRTIVTRLGLPPHARPRGRPRK